MLFAALGPILFQPLLSPSAFESARSWDYAEHKLVESAPKLQWISDALEELTLDMLFHVNFCTPAVQINALVTAAAAHQALPLAFGNGTHRGYFVITKLSESIIKTADDGSLIAASVKVTLRGWTAGAALDPNAPPQPVNPPPAIASDKPNGATAIAAPPPPTGAGGPAPGVFATVAPAVIVRRDTSAGGVLT